MADKNDLYEADVKQLILNNKQIFGDLGKSSLVYEKAADMVDLIADCLLFTQKKGVIGIEIKTAHDTMKRLPKQLKAYSSLCRYVYVLCSDKQVDHVDKVIHSRGFYHVGIISYDLFEGHPIIGVYRKASPSPSFSAYVLTSILWKDEIIKILGAFKHPGKYKAIAKGLKAMKIAPNQPGGTKGGNQWKGGINSEHLTKPQLISNMIGFLGSKNVEDIITNYFVDEMHNPSKAIRFYHFKKRR